ncbi:PepSY domain-containing protein [Reyranella sp. CPCC 100927]|uniref:PepSY domain-containing protein n=1 Tax=Reyranella sp. CPCC 100927 TaxID=2599616 RepID=UPI0015B64A0E|nr:PepSY domain-containing protein [Reyranella sp. CPCC 100927]
MRLILILSAIAVLVSAPAFAKDRPVTDAERAKLDAAVKAEGCSGGTMQYDDDGEFEVDEATCADGKKYDLDFDPSFKLIKRKLDND